MKIVILNECFFTEDHLNRLRSLGDVTVFENTNSAEKATERLKGADIAIIDGFLAPINRTVLESTDRLKLIVLNSTAYTIIDLETASQKGIKVANVPGFSKQSVAELAIGLMFAVIRKIPKGDKQFRENPFEPDPASEEGRKFYGFDIKGKTLGIIGLGRIGTIVAELGNGLGMKVIAYDRTLKQVRGVRMVTLEESFLQNLPNMIVENVESFVKGRPANIVT